jgi:hypothetical protein
MIESPETGHTFTGGNGWTMVLGDCVEVMGTLGGVDHVITDPPYGEHVHSKPWQSKMLTGGKNRASSRHAGIDFDPLTAELRKAVSLEAARLARRWVLVFCDTEGIHGWQTDLGGAGLDLVRVCFWEKVDSSPQFTGDRPASGVESFVCVHPPGRKKWNGGGRRNLFSFPVNAERGGKEHPTTKPIALMLELVSLFTDPGETILDPFAGSGSTGVAALRLGRKFCGIEKGPKYFQLACDRLRAEENGSTLRDLRAGQVPLFGEVAK